MKRFLLTLLLVIALAVPSVNGLEMIYNFTNCNNVNNLNAADDRYGQSFIFNASAGNTCITGFNMLFINGSTVPAPAGTFFEARLHWNESATNATRLFFEDITSQLQMAPTVVVNCGSATYKNVTLVTPWCGLNASGNYTLTIEARGNGAAHQWYGLANNGNPYTNGKEWGDNAFIAANDIALQIYATSAVSTKFQLTLNDTINRTALLTFNATVNGTFYSTTNGTIVTTINASTGLVNISINATNYFTNSSINFDTSSNYVGNVTQWTAIYARSFPGLASITNFSINYTNSTGTFTKSTTATVIYIPIYNENWNVKIFNANELGTNYSSQNATLNGTPYVRNYTFYLYTTNSFNFTFRDERNSSILYSIANISENVIVELLGDLISYNYTANGTLYVDILTPQDYIIRYSKPGYGLLRQYFVSLTNQSHAEIDLYLIEENVSTPITVTVYDQITLNTVPAAVVYLQRFNLTCNCYLTVAMYETDVGGQAFFEVEMENELYKFALDYPWGTRVFTSEPFYIQETELNLYFTDENPIGDIFFNASNMNANIYFTNSTGNLQLNLDYSDSANTASTYCFAIKKWTRYTNLVVNQSCSSSASGTITLGGLEVGENYYGIFTAVINGQNTTIATGWKEVPNDELGIGLFGIFLTFGVYVTFLFLAYQYHVTALILANISLAFSKLIGIFPIDWGYIMLMIIGSIFVALLIDKR